MKRVIINHTITSLLFALFVVWFNILLGRLNLIGTEGAYLNGWMLIYVIFAAPFFEEIIFRLGVFNLIHKITKSPKISIIVSSVLFGLLHIIPGVDKAHIVQAVYAVICGMVLGFTYYESGKKINYTLIMHVVANIATLFIPAVVITNQAVGWISLIVIFVLMLFILDIIIAKGVINFGKDAEKEN